MVDPSSGAAGKAEVEVVGMDVAPSDNVVAPPSADVAPDKPTEDVVAMDVAIDTAAATSAVGDEKTLSHSSSEPEARSYRCTQRYRFQLLLMDFFFGCRIGG